MDIRFRIPVSRAFAKAMNQKANKGGDFSFVQISDSHMGFNKPANPDVVAPAGGGGQNQRPARSFGVLIAHRRHQPSLEGRRIRQRGSDPEVLSRKTYFSYRANTTYWTTTGSRTSNAMEKTQRLGWYSFDKKGVHFMGLVNVMNLKAGGLGSLGGED